MKCILTPIARLTLAPLTALKGPCKTQETYILIAKKKPQPAPST